MVPFSDSAIVASAPGKPLAVSSVPSSGSTAMSTSGGEPSPIRSPLYSIGASSFSPSPITTTPSMRTVSSIRRMASKAAPSADSFSPSPTQRAAASAPYSVTRTSSIARLRSGRAPLESGMRHGLQDARRLAPADALRLPHEAAEGDTRGPRQSDPVADLDRDVDVVRVVAAGPPEDDPVDQDQRERRDADDHRHLARAPGELVPAGDDVGEDERRDARPDQQLVEDAVGPERRERAAVAVELRVGVAPRRHAGLVAARGEPVEEQRHEQDRRAEEADQLGALDAPDVERRPGLLLHLDVVRACPAAECTEHEADAGRDREQPDVRMRQVGLGRLVERLVGEQDRAAEQRAAPDAAERPLACPLVLGAGRIAAEQGEDREHEVPGLVDPEEPAAEHAEGDR